MTEGASQPALHRGVLPVPGRSSEPDGCSRTLIRARYYARPSVRSVKPRLSAPWQRPLRAADGPPGTPAIRRACETRYRTGHRSRLRRMTPHEAPSATRDAIDVTRSIRHVKCHETEMLRKRIPLAHP